MTITGTYLTGATAVSFGSGITVNSYTVVSSSQITANITISSSATLGDRDVSVTTPVGTGTLTGGFKVTEPSPTVASVSPSQGIQGEALTVTITGTYFAEVTAVSFGSGITVDSFTLDSDSQITANITISSSAAAGARDVSVITPAGTGSLTGGFTVTQAAHPNHSKIWIAVGVGAALAVGIAVYLSIRFIRRRPVRKKK